MFASVTAQTLVPLCHLSFTWFIFAENVGGGLLIGGIVTVTRFLSNPKCVIQNQRRHVFPVMLSEPGKLAKRKHLYFTCPPFTTKTQKIKHFSWN